MRVVAGLLCALAVTRKDASARVVHANGEAPASVVIDVKVSYGANHSSAVTAPAAPMRPSSVRGVKVPDEGECHPFGGGATQTVCGIEGLLVCGSLANGGHGGSTQIAFARLPGEPNWLLVKGARFAESRVASGGECKLQQRFVAGGGDGPRCLASCDEDIFDSGGKVSATLLLDAATVQAADGEYTAACLRDAVKIWSQESHYEATLTQVLWKIMVNMYKMLNTGLTNADMNAGNVLVKQVEEGGPVELAFIDFDPNEGTAFFWPAWDVAKDWTAVPRDVRERELGLAPLSLLFCEIDGAVSSDPPFYCAHAKAAAALAAEQVPTAAAEALGAAVPLAQQGLRDFAASGDIVTVLGPDGPIDMSRLMGLMCQLAAATVGVPADFPGYIEYCPGYRYTADGGRRAFFRAEDAPSLGRNPTQVFTAPEGTPPREGTPQAFDQWSATIRGSPGEPRVVVTA